MFPYKCYPIHISLTKQCIIQCNLIVSDYKNEITECVRSGTMIMICHRRCLNVPPLTLVAGIFIFVIFITKQVKDLYERNQKYYRMENYNKFVSISCV